MKLTLRMDQLDPDKFHGYVQAAYNMMRRSDYVTAGEYFMNLYDEHLDELLQSVEQITTPVGLENPVSAENIMMLTILLRTAEGMPDMSEEELHSSIGIVCTYAAMEKLARMGQVQIYHENMCVAVDDESSKRIVVRKM